MTQPRFPAHRVTLAGLLSFTFFAWLSCIGLFQIISWLLEDMA